MDKYAYRQKLLASLIQDRFDGVIARFASAVDIAPSYVSRMLYPETKAGAKRIGESTIEKIETSLGLTGYFSGVTTSENVLLFPVKDEYITVHHLDVQAGMGDGRENPDYPESINEIRFSARFLRSLIGFLPPQGRLVLIDGRGDSMLPTIQYGDTLLADTGINYYDRDGLYLINLGHGVQIKRLMDRGKALYVCSDNPLYKEFQMPEDALIVGRIYLVNRMNLLG